MRLLAGEYYQVYQLCVQANANIRLWRVITDHDSPVVAHGLLWRGVCLWHEPALYLIHRYAGFLAGGELDIIAAIVFSPVQGGIGGTDRGVDIPFVKRRNTGA